MDVAQFALRIVESPGIGAKLAPPTEELQDRAFNAAAPSWPVRDQELEIVPARSAPVPKIRGWPDPRQRRRILHALANHELQAVELYAWALLRFQEAPGPFRRDLLRVLVEEQGHTRAYLRRLEAAGGRFGDHPVSGYFWRKTSVMDTPLRFVAAMSLTFENANLDHTLESRQAALAAGDRTAAELFAGIHGDEIGHVRFGWKWLARLKAPLQSMWSAYCRNLRPPLHPGRASGRCFHSQPRRQAGLDEEFIAHLEDAHRRRVRTAPHGT